MGHTFQIYACKDRERKTKNLPLGFFRYYAIFLIFLPEALQFLARTKRFATIEGPLKFFHTMHVTYRRHFFCRQFFQFLIFRAVRMTSLVIFMSCETKIFMRCSEVFAHDEVNVHCSPAKKVFSHNIQLHNERLLDKCQNP